MAEIPTPAAAPTPRRGKAGPRLLLGVVVILLLVLGIGGLYTWVALHYSYSEGERAGYVQKFSRKGWICKTWEGELAMANLPGTMPQIFNFSVREPQVADRLNQTIGQRVALHYEQHKGVPTTCFGETDYFVTEVRSTEPGAPLLPAPPPVPAPPR